MVCCYVSLLCCVCFELIFVNTSCLILFVFENLSAAANIKAQFGINDIKILSRVSLPFAPFWRESNPRVSTSCLFVKPGHGAPRGS